MVNYRYEGGKQCSLPFTWQVCRAALIFIAALPLSPRASTNDPLLQENSVRGRSVQGSCI